MTRLLSPARWSTRARLLSMAGVSALFALSGQAQAQTCEKMTPAQLSAAFENGQCLELLAAMAPAAGPIDPAAGGSYPVNDLGSDDAHQGDPSHHGNSGDQGNGGGDQGGGGSGESGEKTAAGRGGEGIHG
jgi:hypothetical protein